MSISAKEIMDSDISFLDSWRSLLESSEYVKKVLKKNYSFSHMMEELGTGICPFCDGSGYIKENDLGDIHYCVCNLLRQQNEISRRQQNISTNFKPAVFGNMELWGSKSNRNSLLKAINVVKDWIENDINILVMSGEFGCGKTHLLRIANTYFKPLSLAITAQKLARLFYDGIDDKSLSRNLEILESSPVLLIDDFGAEYQTNFITAQLTGVIDYRYSQDNIKTMLTTNLDIEKLVAYYPRIGDRIIDKQKSKFHRMTNGSYRGRDYYG